MTTPVDTRRSSDTDTRRRLRLALGALALILVSGTVAYRLIGLDWFDAFYQTLITISTVGYAEVGEDIDTRYRVISVFIILVGVGVMLYTVGIAFESLLEGRLTDRLGRNRMARQIDHLENHIVVCGWGQVGRSITQEIAQAGQDVVVIDREPDTFDAVDALAVVGEASDDRVLRAAGLEKARGLVVALDSDAENVYVTLSARELNPDLFIVARSNSPSAETKLRQAGADRVVNPHEIGGRRMAAFIMQPHVADFLGLQMQDQSLDMRMDEVRVSARISGRTVEQCEILDRTNITVLAVRRRVGTFLIHPPGDTELETGDVLISLGTPDEIAALRNQVETPEIPD